MATNSGSHILTDDDALVQIKEPSRKLYAIAFNQLREYLGKDLEIEPQIEKESVSKMNSWNIVTRPLFNYISFLITFVCISIVSYESYHCILKYLSSPQGTSLSIHFIGDTLVFPDITICVHPHPGSANQYGFRYNETFLKDCHINR